MVLNWIFHREPLIKHRKFFIPEINLSPTHTALIDLEKGMKGAKNEKNKIKSVIYV